MAMAGTLVQGAERIVLREPVPPHTQLIERKLKLGHRGLAECFEEKRMCIQAGRHLKVIHPEGLGPLSGLDVELVAGVNVISHEREGNDEGSPSSSIGERPKDI